MEQRLIPKPAIGVPQGTRRRALAMREDRAVRQFELAEVSERHQTRMMEPRLSKGRAQSHVMHEWTFYRECDARCLAGTGAAGVRCGGKRCSARGCVPVTAHCERRRFDQRLVFRLAVQGSRLAGLAPGFLRIRNGKVRRGRLPGALVLERRSRSAHARWFSGGSRIKGGYAAGSTTGQHEAGDHPGYGGASSQAKVLRGTMVTSFHVGPFRGQSVLQMVGETGNRARHGAIAGWNE